MAGDSELIEEKREELQATFKKYGTPPETERRLKELQSAYLEDRNNRQVSNDFFMLLRTYARSLVLKEIKRTGVYYLPDKVEEKATEVTLEVWDQYDNDPDWLVEKSFAGLIRFKILHVLYDKKKVNEEKVFSLNAKFNDDSDSKEVMDVMSYEGTAPWSDSNENMAYEPSTASMEEDFMRSVNVSFEEVNEIIDFSYQNLPYSTFLRFIPWLVLQFRKPKSRNPMALYERMYLTSREISAFEILFLEIHNRILKHTI